MASPRLQISMFLKLYQLFLLVLGFSTFVMNDMADNTAMTKGDGRNQNLQNLLAQSRRGPGMPGNDCDFSDRDFGATARQIHWPANDGLWQTIRRQMMSDAIII